MLLKKITAKNYRTLDDISLNFSDFYTAICGKNNAGKSNLIRAIRSVFDYNDNYEFYYDRMPITYESDFPVWKNSSKDKKDILVKIDFELEKDRDFGIVEFVNKFIGSDQVNDKGILTLSLQLSLSPAQNKPVRSVYVNGNLIEDFEATEIHKKLQNSGLLLVHDSARLPRHYYRSSYLTGVLGSTPEAERDSLEKKQKSFTNAINKAVKKHKDDLDGLIGRLGEKYQVSLSTPEIQIDQLAFELSLDDRGSSIALEDWGSGTRNTTLILKTLFDARRRLENVKDSGRHVPVVIIEEPEAFLHPSAQAKFANVLQDLSEEFKIQVISTTHSPYLLSHRQPSSNILLSRTLGSRGVVLGTQPVPGDEEDWLKPFEHALGVSADDMSSLKGALFSQAQRLILVEGKTDKAYLELCMNPKLEKNALKFKGEIYPYGGTGFLNNTLLLKFIRNRFPQTIITYDLDAKKSVLKNLNSAGYVEGVDCLAVGINEPGKRCIEGLLPESVVSSVSSDHPTIVMALNSDDREERESASKAFKKKCLEEFTNNSEFSDKWYGKFYKLCRAIEKSAKSLNSKASKPSSTPFSGAGTGD